MVEFSNNNTSSLEAENRLFEEFLKRTCSDDDTNAQKGENHNSHHQQLSFNQKLEIVTSELENSSNVTKVKTEAAAKLVETLKALIAETSLRINELKKDEFDFKRSLLLAEKKEISVESIERHIKIKLQQKEIAIEKLLQNITNLKSKKQKAQTVLNEHEKNGGGALKYIESYKLQIENKQLSETIEKANKRYAKLKNLSSNDLANQTNLKHKYTNSIQRKEYLEKQICKNSKMLDKLEQETLSLKSKLFKAEKIQAKIHSKCCSPKEIQVEEYMQLKAELHETEAGIKNWKRKVEIARMMVLVAKRNRSLNNSTLYPHDTHHVLDYDNTSE